MPGQFILWKPTTLSGRATPVNETYPFPVDITFTNDSGLNEPLSATNPLPVNIEDVSLNLDTEDGLPCILTDPTSDKQAKVVESDLASIGDIASLVAAPDMLAKLLTIDTSASDSLDMLTTLSGYMSDVLDTSLNANQVVDVAPTYGRVLDPVTLATEQSLTNTFTEFGAEIIDTGYDQLGIYLNLDWGDSTNVQVKVLYKHTAAHTDEYQQVYLGPPSANKTTLNLNVYEFATDADQKVYFSVPTSNTVTAIQLMIKDDSGGTGKLSGSYIVGYGS